jgi:PAS domain S-box-containing protein
VFPDEVSREFRETFQRVAATGAAGSFEHYFPPWNQWFANEFFVVDEDVICVIARDVTARKFAEADRERLLEQHQRQRDFLERLLELSPVAIAVVQGAELRFTMLNAAYRRIVGLSGSPEVGRTYEEVFPEASARGAAETLRHVMSAGEAWKLRDFSTPMGSRAETWWEGECVALENDTGARDAVLIVTWDITDRKAADRARRQGEEALLEADRQKDEFLATLAHELRNPLAPICTGLSILRMQQDETPVIAMMDRQLGHMVRLVDDLLDVSRVSSGKIALKMERVDLRTIVESAVETSRPLMEAARHELEIHPTEHPISLLADGTRLAQVLSNLLNNAAKYTPPGGRIELAVEASENAIVFRVKDNGVGISRELMPRLFDMFAQGRGTLDHAQGGLGIGLSLAKKLVALHGGTITAHSPGPRKGSTFVVELPRSPERPAKADLSTKLRASSVSSSTGRRILVVDDNQDAAQSLAMLLGLAGHTTHVVNDGPSVLEAVERFHPEVIFLDIGLPGMSGHEVARQLRRRRTLRHLVLVAVTGWGSAEDRQNSRKAGCDFHLTKPVAPNAVHELLAELGRAPKRRGR